MWALLYSFSSCEITVTLFHAPTFSNKTSLIKCTFSNQRQPLPSPGVAYDPSLQMLYGLEALMQQ